MSLDSINRLLCAWRLFVRARVARMGVRPGTDKRTIQLRQRYREALAALPNEQRVVFMLHRIEDLSIVDIAARLNMPTPLVEQHLAAALHAIANALDAPS